MLDRWVVDGDRPALPFALVVLAMCAVAGFVFGGVLASLPSAGGGSADPDPSETSNPIAIDMSGVDVEASCQRESGRDEAGEPVEYLPALVFDDDPQTAWQCRGDGAGETLTLAFDEPVAISRLGLIPGYAKEDPTAGTEWYPRNRRLTEVLWHFDDGDSVSQALDPDPDLRDLQYLAIDEPRTTSTLTMEIVSSELGDGDRPNIAVTEVVIMRP